MAKKTGSGVGVAEKTIEESESWSEEIEENTDFDFDDLIEEPEAENEIVRDGEEEVKEERNGQGILPGTKYAHPDHVAVARDYADYRDLRMDYQRQEKKKLEYLTALMERDGLDELKDGDVHIFSERTRKFKVKIGGDDDSDEA